MTTPSSSSGRTWLSASLLAGTLGALLGLSRRRRPEPLTTARTLVAGHKVLVAGLLGCLGTHAVMVAWPVGLASWTQQLGGLLLVEGAFFLLGLTVLAGLAALMVSHLRHPPRRAIGVVDVSFVGVLLVVVVSGLGIAVLHRWAAAWSSVTLAPYVRSVASLQPDLRYLESMPYLVKVHLFSTSALMALAPFTTPIRMFLSAANRAADRALTPVSAAFADTWRPFQQWARQGRWNPRWSEEDEYE